MDKFIIEGGKELNGELSVQTAKNAILPIVAACILSKQSIIIKSCPQLSDIATMCDIINSLKGGAEFNDDNLIINCRDLEPNTIDSVLTKAIRSSIFILGPILSRFKKAQISYPGGCEIGARPIDIHLNGLRSLNVDIKEKDGIIYCDGKGMKSGVVSLRFPSVGATENIMMAAVLLKGTTTILNAAREPEIIDLQNFINKLGGKISGGGSGAITVEGVKSLSGGEYQPIPDRIYAGTFLTAAAACKGFIRLNNIIREHIDSVCKQLQKAGCEVIFESDAVVLKVSKTLKAIGRIETNVYPDFPTDLQPQLCAMLLKSQGNSEIVENLFENRFCYVQQLKKLGADIIIQERSAKINGVKSLSGNNLSAADLRGGAALVIGALSSDGISIVDNVHHIDRGYYRFENDLSKLGAKITRV